MGMAKPFETHPAAEMETNELLDAINRMIGWYQIRRSTVLALSITDHIEQLGCRVEQGDTDAGIYDYKRLADAWRYIASQR